MSRKSTIVWLAVVTAASVPGAAAMANDRDDHGQERGGAVIRCSLAGVNPAVHPEVFGNAATAESFGFYQAPDHTWHVRADCRR